MTRSVSAIPGEREAFVARYHRGEDANESSQCRRKFRCLESKRCPVAFSLRSVSSRGESFPLIPDPRLWGFVLSADRIGAARIGRTSARGISVDTPQRSEVAFFVILSALSPNHGTARLLHCLPCRTGLRAFDSAVHRESRQGPYRLRPEDGRGLMPKPDIIPTTQCSYATT